MVEVTQNALIITGFVFVMMLVMEYVNVLTRGRWQTWITRSRWKQYVIAALLGAIPGCLGAFAVVSMYVHRVVSMGAVVAAMIATSGDEAFVMFAMIPQQAIPVMGVLLVVGIGVGFVTDIIYDKKTSSHPRHNDRLEIHTGNSGECFPDTRILEQWKACTAARGVLIMFLVFFLLLIMFGHIGLDDEYWMRITLIIVTGLALFIVNTVPDHFLEVHLWQHVVRNHVPTVFLWTLGALMVMYGLREWMPQVENTIHNSTWTMLLVACVFGLIPESGPHLVFVTLYAQQSIPLSILVANSIVQDGHGMLPMLAHSRRDFIYVKAVNFGVGLIIGAVALSRGW
jgi:hypothetical protein